MSDNTSIEWSDATWSPLLGCDRVSPGCDNCYAIVQAHIRAANPHPRVAAAFVGLTKRTEHGIDWTGQINQLPDRLSQPLAWRKPRRVFVNSLSDLFHDKVEVDFIAQVFAVMSLATQHDFQLLTKRHGRMRSLLNNEDFVALVDEHRERMQPGCGDFVWPLPNLWLGVSAEDQKRAELRIPALLATPAAVRWVSAEPLLGPIDLNLPRCDDHNRRDIVTDDTGHEWCGSCSADGFSGELSFGHWLDPLNGGIGWVVTGGESGPGARPAHPAWFRNIRNQCQETGVAYLHKQHGAYTWQINGPYRDPELYVSAETGETVPSDVTPETGRWAGVWRVGKKAAGRDLDGRTWDEYPEPHTAVAS